jgi:hypothetical protein
MTKKKRPPPKKKKFSQQKIGKSSEDVPDWVPHYTSSVDAAIPGENIVSVQLEETSGRWIAVNRGEDGRLYIGSGNTEPLARRGAGLRAAQAQEQSRDIIPASDRRVGPDHNSSEFRGLIASLDRLVDAIEENNQYAASDPDDRDRQLAELRSAKIILTGSTSMRPAFVAAVASSLTYLCIKFADTFIGKLAEHVFDFLQKVFGA